MAKYRKKQPIIEAKVYEKGMEDGYAAYQLFSDRFIGYFDKNEALPKVALNPAIKSKHGWEEVGKGDYIVIYEDGSKDRCPPELFHEFLS